MVAFHRGHWCPYCRITADALTRIHGAVQARGAELVVITPEIERFNAQLRSAVGARFPVLSDMDNGYALMLNLAFYVGDEKKQVMKFAGWNIPPYNANDNWTLPIPATFVVGRTASSRRVTSIPTIVSAWTSRPSSTPSGPRVGELSRLAYLARPIGGAHHLDQRARGH